MKGIDDTDRIVTLPCACANLRRAARAVTQLYDGELHSSGVKITQFTLLQALARVPGVTQGRLGELLALDSTTLSRTLRPLIRRGWVRGAIGRDRRERVYELTGAGLTGFRRRRPQWERAQQRLRKALGTYEWKQMETDLVRITAAALRG